MLFLYTGLFLFVILAFLVYCYFTRAFNYWKSRNIVGPKPLPFFGNYKNFVWRKSVAAEVHKQIYNDYPNERVVGFYRMSQRSLLIRDLDIVTNVLVKDFEFFEDRGIELSIEGLGANLFHADADIWRPLRNRFSPLFTTGKLKNMVPLINKRSDIFIDHVKNITKIQSDQDVYSLFKEFTVSSISACIFGLDVNADNQSFSKKMNEIDQLAFNRNFAMELDFLLPSVLKNLTFSRFHKELYNFFLQLVEDVIKARNGVPSTRKDLIDLILELKLEALTTKKVLNENNMDKYVKLTNAVIAAQAFIFYVAGYETNASALAFMLYELAMNPSIQQKLIAEVDEAIDRHNGKITYEIISELTYMDKVLNETLRKYPITDVVRRTKANYDVPGTKITIEKGITIVVPLLGISYDKKYYPNPEVFDPERFSPENKNKRHPCAFIPFGEGPRHCIGKLFARIQSHVCLIKFLSNFRVEACNDTPATIAFNPNRVSNSPQGGVILKIVRRKATR